jgi:hypothetical protein
MYTFPIIIHRRVRVAALFGKVSNGVALTAVKLALYANDIETARPGEVIVETGEIATTTTGDIEAVVSTERTIPPGNYWLATLVNGAAEMRAVAATNYSIASLAGGNTIDQLMANTGQLVGFRAAKTYGSGIPADLTGTSWTAVATAVCPLIGFKTAA